MMAGLDPRLVPRPRVRPERRGVAARSRRRASRWPSRRSARTAGGSTTGGAPERHRLVPGLLPRDGRPDELGRRRLRPAQRRGDVPDPRRPRRRGRTRSRSSRRPAGSESSPACPTRPGGQPHHYLAPDFDTLVDCPIYAGNPAVYEFEVDGKPHYLVNEGEGGVWDGPRSARDVEAIVRAAAGVLGLAPLRQVRLLQPPDRDRRRAGAQELDRPDGEPLGHPDPAGLPRLARPVSHEFFHAWNVKRLRPVELGPFDYENEVTTRSLWIAEGLTSYYDRLLVRRAGLCTVEEYLEGEPPPAPTADKPRNDIEALQDTPGRLVQPLESASFDAWIKYLPAATRTRPTPPISYYTKGAVVGFLLDAEIRRATDGARRASTT